MEYVAVLLCAKEEQKLPLAQRSDEFQRLDVPGP
jgi:hypothetical protein